MTEILVRPPQLRATAKNLHNHAHNIHVAIQDVDSHIRALGPATFEGNKANDLRNRYSHQREYLIQVQKKVVYFAQMLEKAAQTFEEADRKLVENSGFIPRIIDWIRNIFKPGQWPSSQPFYLPFLPALPISRIMTEIGKKIWDLLPKDPSIKLPDWFNPHSQNPYQPIPEVSGKTEPGTGSDVANSGTGGTTPISTSIDPYPANPERVKQELDSIKDLDVESSYRYQQNCQGNGETYCNIFTMDYAKKMGAPLPEYLDWNKDGQVDRYLDANKAVAWLRGDFNEGGGQVQQGPSLGWQKMSADEAAQMASKGYVVVAGWENQGGIGHMAVVRPESTPGNILIAQAGASNFSNGPVSQGFGSRAVEYFVYTPQSVNL